MVSYGAGYYRHIRNLQGRDLCRPSLSSLFVQPINVKKYSTSIHYFIQKSHSDRHHSSVLRFLFYSITISYFYQKSKDEGSYFTTNKPFC